MFQRGDTDEQQAGEEQYEKPGSGWKHIPGIVTLEDTDTGNSGKVLSYLGKEGLDKRSDNRHNREQNGHAGISGSENKADTHAEYAQGGKIHEYRTYRR
ncbi:MULTISPECIES: hypothetical protein [Actinotignum]|uniref:hypothetical protein n=1 Tax=Actinotignum TaxID=1653174 RepID=UPI00254A3AAE|nr:hypothetical protein [Actinotignum schaalii]MDK7270994.1 hypothetical protein [Actinotignum schaalii]MDY5130311.1 hypothetical protein [Actinotignum timonense]